MKSTRLKKIRLSRETLIKLDPEHLAGVAGAGPTGVTVCITACVGSCIASCACGGTARCTATNCSGCC